MELTTKQVAGMIDHTNLHADATTEDFKKLCEEAIHYGFISVAINTYPVKMCREFLEGSSVLTGAAVGFPLGQTTIKTKMAEASNAIADGCQEFDYVLNVGKVKEHDWDYIREEMKTLVSVAHEHGVTCKVIFEICYLSDEEIIACAKIASEVKPDFIKTSTGFAKSGATVEAVKLMKANCGSDVQVKAAGGIRDYDTLKAMIEAGATRIGCSSGIKIINEMKERGLE